MMPKLFPAGSMEDLPPIASPNRLPSASKIMAANANGIQEKNTSSQASGQKHPRIRSQSDFRRPVLFARVRLYLLQGFQNLIGQANVDNWEIDRNDCYDEHAADHPTHKNLRSETEFR
jgi:hypothetical protein